MPRGAQETQLKTLLKIVGSIIIVLLVVLGILRFTGLNPHERIPGLWLSGSVVTAPVTDWSFTDQVFTLHIQTNTAYLLPHSVTTYCATLNGHLYVGSSNPPVRHWNKEALADPNARLGIGDKIYDVRLVPVTDPAESDALLVNRRKKYPKYKQPAGTTFILFRVEQ
jgi:hypothetical protein